MHKTKCTCIVRDTALLLRGCEASFFFHQTGVRKARAQLLLYIPVSVCVCVFVCNYHVR